MTRRRRRRRARLLGRRPLSARKAIDASAGPVGTPQFRAAAGASSWWGCDAWVLVTREPGAPATRRTAAAPSEPFGEHLVCAVTRACCLVFGPPAGPGS
jgi:hypothetical protein